MANDQLQNEVMFRLKLDENDELYWLEVSLVAYNKLYFYTVYPSVWLSLLVMFVFWLITRVYVNYLSALNNTE